MDRKNWLLLALDMAGERGLDPVQLQKALFIFGEELKKNGTDQYFNFRPYDYGPFDVRVYSAVEDLERVGSVCIEPSQKSRRHYRIAGTAGALVDQIKREIPPEESAYLKRVVEWVQSVPFEELLRAVYRKYPAMATKSVFRG